MFFNATIPHARDIRRELHVKLAAEQELREFTKRLNAQSSKPVRKPAPERMTAKQREDFAVYRKGLEEAVEARVQGIEAYPPLGSLVHQQAMYHARKKKLDACERCGKRGYIEMHHTVPVAQLKLEGRYNQIEAHVFEYVCDDCHIDQHRDEPVLKLMLGSKTKRGY